MGEFSRVGKWAAPAFQAVALLLMVTWSTAQGDDGLPEGSGDEVGVSWYDGGHDYVTDRLQRAAVWLDDFFGDPRAEKEKQASAYMHVVLDAFYSGVEDQSENGVRFRGGVDLPKLDRRLRLLVTSDADSTVTGRELAGTAKDDVKDTDGAVGLSYLFRDRPGHKFSLGGGLSGGLSPALLLAGRYVHTRHWTTNTASHVTSTVYWKSEDGPGVSTLLDYEWSPDADTLWRTTLFGNYKEEIRGLEWSAQAKWAKRLNSKTAINVRGGFQGQTEPNSVLSEGWLKFLYRRNVLRPWLFYELEPGFSWPESLDYRGEPTFAVRLEIQFRRD